ncbi:hypothetical protein E2C01_037345 [Portunus trituberculatus]|uniref:Uncharacterized protein n=1 Tax=Portunus trituberculatus TaxID=210409 RepID=A0A5B7FF25_PORTR|nr:hypothetical protein [Portunus trituberculatus]
MWLDLNQRVDVCPIPRSPPQHLIHCATASLERDSDQEQQQDYKQNARCWCQSLLILTKSRIAFARLSSAWSSASLSRQRETPTIRLQTQCLKMSEVGR